MTTYLALLIAVFWAISAAKSVFFWEYLWQIKEYRRDRMRAHFELASSQRLLLNKRLALIGVLLVITLLSRFLSEWVQFFAALGALVFYGILCVRTIEQFQKRRLRIPAFTSRVIASLGVTATLYAAFFALVWVYAPQWLLQAILVADAATPLVVALGIAVFTPLSAMTKRRIMEQARAKRASLEGVLAIGITGSYAKTSVKEYTAAILSQKFKVLKTEANNNTEIGIANTILKRLDENYDVFVAEMGAYRKGEIAASAAMVMPSMAVLTGIGPQHLSLFGSMQNIQEAKYELIAALPEKGLAIFNGDDDHARALFRQCKNPKRIYTTDPLSDPTLSGIRAESIRFLSSGMEIRIKDGKETETITTSLLGRHNATNLLGAISVARALGMDYEEIQAGIKTIRPIAHTLQIMRGIKETTVVDDSYSGNVRGVFAALEVLSRMKGRRKILVLQPLIELGPAAEKAHKEIGAKIGEVCDYCIVVASDYFTPLYREALASGMNKSAMMCIPDPHQALRKIQELSDKGDIIMLENRVGNEILRGVIAQGPREPDEKETSSYEV